VRANVVNFTESLCEKSIGGWTENLALICIQIPLTFAMTLLGTVVVSRYKIDVPQYTAEEEQEVNEETTETKDEPNEPA